MTEQITVTVPVTAERYRGLFRAYMRHLDGRTAAGETLDPEVVSDDAFIAWLRRDFRDKIDELEVERVALTATPD
jgi:hypothetical protein